APGARPRGADTRQPGTPRVGAAGPPLGSRLREAQEALGAIRKPGAIGLDAAGPRLREHLDGEGDEARVPPGDATRVEGEPMDGPVGLELAPHLARVGQRMLLSQGAA